jgi:hypothetical protein
MKLFSKVLAALLMLSAIVWSCNNKTKPDGPVKTDSSGSDVAGAGAANFYDTSFKVEAESFADLQMLRYQVPGFDGLSLQQKQLAYTKLLYVVVILFMTRKASMASCCARQLITFTALIKEIPILLNGKNLQNIAAGFGSAMATIIIMVMKNFYLTVHLNILLLQ